MIEITQGERIKKCRKALGLTLEKFGEQIGMKKNSVSQLENGKNSVTEQVIKSICREFNIDERWLRFGDGDMFVTHSRNDEITIWVSKLTKGNSDTFPKRFASMLARLDEGQWELLEKMALMLYEDKEKD